MAMVSADGSSQSFGGLTARIGWFGLRVGGNPALCLHSSNEPGELSQWLCHDDNTINIVSKITIITLNKQTAGSDGSSHWNTHFWPVTQLPQPDELKVIPVTAAKKLKI